MFTPKNRQRLDPIVRDTMDSASSESMQRFLKEHRFDGTHNVRPSGFDFVPIGSMVMWGTDAAPDGWLLCDGSQVSRTTYQALFNIVGTTYGAGDGSATFNVPDFRQRFPLGKAASGTGSALGATGGTIDHVHTGPSHTHTGPSHTHSISSDGAHSHSVDSHSHSISVDGDHDHGGSGNTTGSAGSHSHDIDLVDDSPDQKTVDTNLDASTDSVSALGHVHTSGSTDSVADHNHSFTISNDGDHSHGGSTGAQNTGTNTASAHSHGGATGSSGTGNTGASGTGNTGTANPPFLTINMIILAGV